MSEKSVTGEVQERSRTAGEAGRHVSRYNLMAKVPDSKMTAVVNLYKGTCAEYTPIECYLLSVLEELDEHHPIIERFARRGIICDFDERAALETMGRAACNASHAIGLTICPTMGCNFDCPYCFEDHRASKMTKEVQDDVVTLAERMLDASGAKNINVTWFGGEPLLAPDVIESLSTRLERLAEEHGGRYVAEIVTNGYLLTQDIVDMLAEHKVTMAQVTIDGIGATHDATRHLAGGGATYDRIIGNLANNRIPFKVSIRHNVHDGNRDQVEPLEALIRQMAKDSGNKLSYYPAVVMGSDAADARGRQVSLLCGSDASEVGMRLEAERFMAGRGSFCMAHMLWSIGIDERGNLQKCWESVDKPQLSFGRARDWDPRNPLKTASDLDNLTMYLNTANPVPDEECRECVWLPLCAGGCPYRRLHEGHHACVPFKDEPERYALALHARMQRENQEKKMKKEEEERES